MVVLHIVIAIWVIVASIRWGDWKRWEQYYPTMLYIISAGLVYEFFAQTQFHLWKMNGEWLLNHSIATLLHIFIINPLATFIFLSNYPDPLPKQLFHITKWVIIFLIVEWAGLHFDYITHSNGWSLGWSALFLFKMFPILRLHFTHKLWAITLSVFCVLFYLFIFDYM
ncbi:CBO0543 family protein [Aquibacillus albus]|uniref:CBO0543 family protein n=1 Tax=Aquibacillus albus TaxID=1168171 RepID=UPI00195EE115|nr:CBO0543 family protein [Aquibacillus albus]